MTTLLDEHFRAPRNVGALDDADLQVEVDNPVCGDVLRLSLRCGADGVVEDARFQVNGCPAAIAAGSVLTELLMHKSRDEVACIDSATVDAALGGLAAESRHVAVLACDAVRSVVERWQSKRQARDE